MPLDPNRQKKRFACYAIEITKQGSRGVGDDPSAMLDELENEWTTLQDKLEKDEAGEKDTMKDYFNGLLDGEDDLGDHLFGDFGDFKQRVNLLDGELKQTFMDELQIQEVFISKS